MIQSPETAHATSALGDLVSRPLLTHEMGSLDKPGWRVKAYAGKPLDEQDLADARRWGERVGVARYGELIELLQQGISPDAIWQVLFDTAAELLMHEPGTVPLHAQTTANALYYAYRVCGDEQTQQLTLLQCAAFMTMFRKLVGTTQPDLSLEALQPLPLDSSAVDAIDEIFADVADGRRLQAARKSLGYLQSGGDAEALIAKARHHLVYNADEPHDYKFSEAVFDSYAHLSNSAWRWHFLSSGMAYFKGPAKRPGPVVEQMSERLRA